MATQFNAIFRADANQTESSVSLLGMWMARRIHAFLNLLTTHLAGTEDPAQVRDALEASVFFASSMGRLGADFSAQLGPIFETRMHAIVTKPWKDGANQLKETLSICSNAGIAAPLVSHASIESTPDGPLVGDIPLEDPQPPPRQLMELPPLARFVNAILTGVSVLCVHMITIVCIDVWLVSHTTFDAVERASPMHAAWNRIHASHISG